MFWNEEKYYAISVEKVLSFAFIVFGRLEVQGQTLFEVWLTLSEYKCQVKYGENLRSWQINIKESLSSDSRVFLPFRIIF